MQTPSAPCSALFRTDLTSLLTISAVQDFMQQHSIIDLAGFSDANTGARSESTENAV